MQYNMGTKTILLRRGELYLKCAKIYFFSEFGRAVGWKCLLSNSAKLKLHKILSHNGRKLIL